mgnify:CR=1 FL=1
MPRKGESKQDAFVRLANARIPRVLEEMRLVGQLTNRSYIHDEAQAEEIISTLAQALEEISGVFQVPFSVAVGDDAQYAEQSNHLVKAKQKTGEVDVMAVAMAIEEIEARRFDSAKAILKRALLGH